MQHLPDIVQIRLRNMKRKSGKENIEQSIMQEKAAKYLQKSCVQVEQEDETTNENAKDTQNSTTENKDQNTDQSSDESSDQTVQIMHRNKKRAPENRFCFSGAFWLY